MGKTIINDALLDELGKQLVSDIQNRTDFFGDFTIVVPGIRTEQWFKAYWLKTQNEILMNVSFRLIDNALLDLINIDGAYELVPRDMLKLLIVKHLVMKSVSSIPAETTRYVFGDNGSVDAIKLHDLAEKLCQLYIEYDIECFNCNGWEKELYDLVMDDASKAGFGTLRSILESVKGTVKRSDTLYFFGFSGFSAIQQTIIDEYSKNSNVRIYMLDTAEDIKDSSVIAAPSRLREIEAVHGKICSLLEGTKRDSEGNKIPDNRFSDFLVLAPDISVYEPYISRVFEQDGKDFPMVPYVINDRKRVETDVLQGLRKLVEIRNKGFYTRLDFSELINNKAIQRSRGISPEDVEYWMGSVLKMNVFRNGQPGEDWDYAKKRVLLSKVSNINDIGENVISLDGKEYLPFSSIGFEDDSLVRFVAVIDDLKSWMDATVSLNTVGEKDLDDVKGELDKWFSNCNADGEETNFRYKKLIDVFKFWKKSGMPDNLIPLRTFFYVPYGAGTVTRSANGEFFTKGVTFASFDENAVVSAEHVFFLNVGSREFPKPYVKSELDQRSNVEKEKAARTAERFALQHQNAGNFTVSYINRNLKTDEKYFISSLINWWNESNEEKIGIDEDRDWDKLYTRKEYKTKEYRISLLPKAVHIPEIKRGPSLTHTLKRRHCDWEKTITTKDMSRFLDEPLKYKASRMFGWHDDSEEEIHDQYEQFVIDNLTGAKLLKKMLLGKHEAVKSTVVIKDFKDDALMKRDLPMISDYFTDAAFEGVSAQFTSIEDYIGNNYDLIAPEEIQLKHGEQSCRLVCSEKVFRSINGTTRFYLALSALRDGSNKTFPNDYTYLYVTSLMDIANLDGNTEWTVNMYRGVNGNGLEGTYSITPEKARKLLTGISYKMNEGKIAFMPIEYLFEPDGKEKDLESVSADSSGRTWQYFQDRSMFDKEVQLGYSRKLFGIQYNKMRNSMKKLVLFR